MHKKLVLFSLISFFSFDAYSAQLRDAREIFQEPAKGSLTQIFAGLAQAKVAQMMWPGLSQHEKLVAEAKKELNLAQRLPTSEFERNIRSEATAKAIAEVENNRLLPKAVTAQVLKESAELPTLLEQLEFYASTKVVTADEKAALIAAADAKVEERVAAAVAAAQAEGFLAKSVRVVRYGASVLFVLDAASRVYVWNMYDANPGFSPVVGYTAAQINALLGY